MFVLNEITILYFALAFLCTITLILFFYSLFLHKKFNSLLVGEAKNLPTSFKETKKNLADLRMFEKEILTRLAHIDTRIEQSVKKVQMVRFTPFSGIGSNGNQSFSLSLLDEKGNGVVLSGLYYGQERVSLFVKPVEAFISNIELTPEEKEVIASSKK